jgi:ribosome biogenesis GTPase A
MGNINGLIYVLSILIAMICFRLEENEKLLLTPFEKNLDIWRQLWRVLERSDLVMLCCL